MAVMPELLKTLAGEARFVVHERLPLVVSVRAQVQQLIQLGEVALGGRLLQVLVVGIVVERIPAASQHLLARAEDVGVDVLRQTVVHGAALC